MSGLKQRLRDLPISRKIVLAIMAVSGIVAFVICTAFFVSELLGIRRATEQQIATLGEIIAANSTAALAFDNPEDAAEVLAALRSDAAVEAAAIYDSKGRIFSRFAANPGNEFPEKPATAGYRFESGFLVGFQPIILGGKPLGTLFIRYSLGAINERLWLYGGIIAVVMAVTFLLSYGLSGALERRITQPIAALAATAQQVSRSRDYSLCVVPTGSRDEIGHLTTNFNEMLAEIQALKADLEQRVEDRTRQLQDANRELEAFSYSVSHDLRAPLRHVHGFIALLESHAGPSMDEKARRYTDTISRAAKQMGRLIDDLLAFSRIGRADIHKVDVDQDALVARVIKESTFANGGREVNWSIAPLPHAQADPGLLRLVWMNLIDNAVKYSSKAAAPRVEIGAMASPDGQRELVFHVRDNGVGFDMKYAGKLFGVFQRLHGPAEFEGTGIGLANVQRIVHRHGGRVWAEARLGEGASFFFSLPTAETKIHEQVRLVPAAHPAVRG